MTSNSRAVATDTCRLCAPLGACLAFRGVQEVMPLIHGSQGCATYARRFAIGHFREPFDIGSTGFSEATTVFGGAELLLKAVSNLNDQYHPAAIGLATTCLSETIGEAVRQILKSLPAGLPPVVHAATPSYAGDHVVGWRTAVASLVEQFAIAGETSDRVLLLPPLISPGDSQGLLRFSQDCGVDAIVLPDLSALAAPLGTSAVGGTAIADIKAAGFCAHAFDLSEGGLSPSAQFLQRTLNRSVQAMGLPIGVEATDRLQNAMTLYAKRDISSRLALDRGLLLDAYSDGHKFCFGKRVAIVGDEDLVAGLCRFANELGMTVVLAASGGSGERCSKATAALPIEHRMNDADHAEVESVLKERGVDLAIGHSRLYPLARRLNIPLVRVGFPIHDRLGAGRIRCLGYDGSLDLFERIVNAIIAKNQDTNPNSPMVM